MTKILNLQDALNKRVKAHFCHSCGSNVHFRNIFNDKSSFYRDRYEDFCEIQVSFLGDQWKFFMNNQNDKFSFKKGSMLRF
jgi:hypothetical protein